MRLRALGALALLCGAPAFAADDLKLSGSVRLRYEGIHGQLRPGFNRDESVVALRSIVGVEYGPGPVSFVAELWDSRMFGTNPRSPISNNEVNTLELVQAHLSAKLDGALGDGSKLKLDIGRMMINIGSRRLVAADDYRNTTNGSTGISAAFEQGKWRGQLIYVLPQYRLPDDRPSIDDEDVRFDRESFDLVLWGGTVGRRQTLGKATLEASFYHLGEDDAPRLATRNRSLDTYGGRIIRDPEPERIDYEIEAFRQTGSTRTSTAPNAASLDVRAWFAHAEIGYQWGGRWKPRIAIEYDQASGDGPGARFTRFDTLFGMRRADFTPAGIHSAIGRTNLIHAGVRLEVASKRTDAFVSYHPSWLDQRTDSFATSGIRDATGRSGRFAGHILDARARHWIVPDHLRFEINAVLIVNGRFIKEAPNGLPRDTSSYLALAMQAQF